MLQFITKTDPLNRVTDTTLRFGGGGKRSVLRFTLKHSTLYSHYATLWGGGGGVKYFSQNFQHGTQALLHKSLFFERPISDHGISLS